MCRKLGITLIMSSAYHPQTDGQTERMNQVVTEVLRNFLSMEHAQWDQLLPHVEFVINNSVSATTKETPFYMNQGRHPRTPLINHLSETNDIEEPQLRETLQDLVLTHQRVKILMQSARDKQKFYADQKRRPLHFEVGDQVLLSTKNLTLQGMGPRKLYPRFIGPFPIAQTIGASACKLTLPDGWRMHPVFHVSLLKPYHPPLASDPVPLPALDPAGHPLYQISTLIGRRVVSKQSEYRVLWAGFPAFCASWEHHSKVPTNLQLAYNDSCPPG